MITVSVRLVEGRIDASVRFKGALVGRIRGRVHEDGSAAGAPGRCMTQSVLIDRRYRGRGFAVAALAALIRSLGIPAVEASRAQAAGLIREGSPSAGARIWARLAQDPAFEVGAGVARLRAG